MEQVDRMALVLLVGTDAALLEGAAQTLGSAGHRVRLAGSVEEARSVALTDPPMLLVLERSMAVAARSLGVCTAPGGATVLFRATNADDGPLPAGVHRGVLADITLPLERQRLTALASNVVARAHQVGRSRTQTPEEHHRL
jgi:DNA-binding NtrC family response regulator